MKASEIGTASFSGAQFLGFVFVCLVEDLECKDISLLEKETRKLLTLNKHRVSGVEQSRVGG